jgi:hydrogenase-4 component E
MISPAVVTLTKLLLVLVLFSTLLVIVQRNIVSLFKLYAAQSFLMALVAFVLFVDKGAYVLLSLAIITVVVKVSLIPYTLYRVHAGAAIRRDVEFRYLTPVSSAVAGIFIVVFIYYVLNRTLPPGDTLLTMGAVIGISQGLIGMMIIFSRKKVITKIIGYLTMENGILLFGLFMAELPLIIELLIIVDLIIFMLLAVVLAFGIDASVEDFHRKLDNFTGWLKRQAK